MSAAGWAMLGAARLDAALRWDHDEEPEFSSSDIAFMLSVVFGFLIVHLVLFVLGGLWAWRAGRGSPLALSGWTLVAMIESAYVAAGVADLFLWDNSYPILFLPLVPLLIQVALYRRARSR